VVLLCLGHLLAPDRPLLSQSWIAADRGADLEPVRPAPGFPTAVVTSLPGRGPVPPVGPPAALPSRSPGAAACPRYAGGVDATEPDRATTERVNSAWLRIERWLSKHAPATRASLRRPAAPERVHAAQARMSVAFPPDLVASLRRHDGADQSGGGFTLPPFHRPMSLDQIIDEWVGNCSVMPEVGVFSDWWDRAFVPFATLGDGGCLLVDQRPGGHGRVGEFYPEDGTSFQLWPASVGELLDGVARSLETGRPYAGRYRPLTTPDGTLDWSIDSPR
jgi:cell wall assembly regulator SMI1